MPNDPVGVANLAAGAGVARVSSRSRQLGGETVHEQRIIPISERVRTGVYLCQTGAHVVLAAADAATAARWFLINPVGSTVLVAFRRVEYMSQLGSALVTLTSPRLQLERFAFTGTASGGIIAHAKRATSDANAAASVRSANTGMSISGQVPLYAFLPVAAATAVSYNSPAVADWNPDEEGMPVLAAGEGVMLRQADPGTASDTRRYITSIAWEEYVIP